MARHEEPIQAHLPKPCADGPARGPQAPAPEERSLGAAAQLAAVHRTLRHGPILQLRGRGIVQRAIETNGGSFDKPEYGGFRDGAEVGAKVTITFMPNGGVRAGATKVGMIQTNRRTVMDHPHNALRPARKRELTDIEAARSFHGTAIDRVDFDAETGTMRQNNPVYQSADNEPPIADQPAKISQSLGDMPALHEHRGQLWTSAAADQAARLVDRPSYPAAQKNRAVVDVFETVALVLEGDGANTYLGSVKWGWEAQGYRVEPRKFELGSKGNPSRRFLGAAKKWNEQQIPADPAPGGNLPLIKIPIPGEH